MKLQLASQSFNNYHQLFARIEVDDKALSALADGCLGRIMIPSSLKHIRWQPFPSNRYEDSDVEDQVDDDDEEDEEDEEEPEEEDGDVEGMSLCGIYIHTPAKRRIAPLCKQSLTRGNRSSSCC
jgi:hypothetical protein